MEQSELIELVLRLNEENKTLKEDVLYLKKEREKTNEAINEMRITMARTEGKIDVLVASIADMKACNERVQKKIEDIENNSRINIMKDIIKPALIALVGGGGLIAYIMNK